MNGGFTDCFELLAGFETANALVMNHQSGDSQLEIWNECRIRQMLDQFDRKAWDYLISLARREMEGTPVSEEELEPAMEAVCNDNIPPEAYAKALESVASELIQKLESWFGWFVVNRKTDVKFRAEFLERLCAFLQNFFGASLLAVMFSQNVFNPLAWNIFAFAFLFSCVGSTWYREKHTKTLSRFATEENVANQFLKLVKQLNPDKTAIKGE